MKTSLSKLTKKITKKVIFKASAKEEGVASEAPQSKTETPTKRICHFCKNGSKPIFTDVASLRRFLSDRGKILPRAKTGICSKHQKGITKAIKHARHLALLPFASKV